MNPLVDVTYRPEELPVYPKGSRLLLDDERFWVCRSISGGLIVFLSLSETISIPSKLDVFKGLHLLSDNRYKGSRILCELESSGLEERFLYVAKHIALKSVDVSNESLFNHVYQQLGEWSAFLRPRRVGILHETLLGLWGEFHVLTHHLLDLMSPVDALLSFVGPKDAPQDFVFTEKALEVKTTLKSSPAEILISSAEQLRVDVRELGLAMIQIVESDEGTCLAQFLERVAEIINPDHPLVADLWKRIHQKIEDASEGQLNQRFRVLRERCWNVEGDFPKIVSDSLPSGVIKVQYSISITSISDFENIKGIRGFVND